MSTKIYYARRVPIGRLNTFIDEMRGQWQRRITRRLREIMLVMDLEGWEPPPGTANPYLAEQRERYNRAMDLAEKASRSSIRNPFHDIDCSLNVWLYRSHAYVIPCGESWMVDHIRWPKPSVDFSYWNNTDPPANISDRRWNYRRSVWDRINCGSGTADHNARRLNHEVVDMKMPAIHRWYFWHQRILPELPKTKLAKLVQSGE